MIWRGDVNVAELGNDGVGIASTWIEGGSVIPTRIQPPALPAINLRRMIGRWRPK
jgi:hypothetical protein